MPATEALLRNAELNELGVVGRQVRLARREGFGALLLVYKAVSLGRSRRP